MEKETKPAARANRRELGRQNKKKGSQIQTYKNLNKIGSELLNVSKGASFFSGKALYQTYLYFVNLVGEISEKWSKFSAATETYYLGELIKNQEEGKMVSFSCIERQWQRNREKKKT